MNVAVPNSFLVSCLILILCRRFIRRCKQGCLQFVFLKPVLVIITLILYEKGKYEDGNFNPTQSYLYLTIIYTISYSVALYALVLFYMACRDLLHPFNPVPKFVIIKSVVFLTYWQVGYFVDNQFYLQMNDGVCLILLPYWKFSFYYQLAVLQYLISWFLFQGFPLPWSDIVILSHGYSYFPGSNLQLMLSVNDLLSSKVMSVAFVVNILCVDDVMALIIQFIWCILPDLLV